MPRTPSKQPTELELEILKVIWEQGACTVSEVRAGLEGFRKLAHTSVMTMMGIMVDKGFLSREKLAGGYVYRARVRKDSTIQKMLRDVVSRAFDGAAGAAALHLLELGELSEKEIEALRALVAEHERKG